MARAPNSSSHRAQSPEVDVQRSTMCLILVGRYCSRLCVSVFPLPLILFRYLPSSPTSSFPLSFYLWLWTALLSGAAPSRVHPIPGFNWDINKVCLALLSNQLSLGIGIEALPIQLVLHNGNVKFYCSQKRQKTFFYLLKCSEMGFSIVVYVLRAQHFGQLFSALLRALYFC